MDHALQSYYPAAMWLGPSGEIIQPVSVAVVGAKNTNNNTLVAAVSGKCIRVLSLNVGAAEAAVSYAAFKNGSGGGGQLTVVTASNATAVEPNTTYPFNPAGWINTSSGVGVYYDVGATGGVYVSCTYVAYTPVA